MTAEADFTHRLVEHASALKPLLDEHLADQEGELLAYLFMGDVAAWLHQHSATEADAVRDVLDWLEVEFEEGDFDTRNLIDVGMVEMLPALPEGAAVLDMLGPGLHSRAEIAGLITPPAPA
ncbi:DUF7674 family protein [Nocardioides renjunii]